MGSQTIESGVPPQSQNGMKNLLESRRLRSWSRRVVVLGSLAGIWELLVIVLDVNPLLFPRFSEVMLAFFRGFGLFGGDGQFWSLTFTTMNVLLRSYAISIGIAVVITSAAVSSKWGRELLTALTGMFQPLPSIALLPMAILWFGLSPRALIFVVIMSMVWPIAGALTTGYATIPETIFRLGRNFELGRIRMITSVLLPMALPTFISGAKVGWGYGWRTVVAAELVFGATGAQGGLGWYINNTRIYLNVSGSLSAVLVVVAIGLLTEGVFTAIQRSTTFKWGMEKD